MSALIVLTHHQGWQWPLVKQGLDSLAVKPDAIYIASDRNTEKENEDIRKTFAGYGIYKLMDFSDTPPIGRWNPVPFLSGHRRNEMIDIAIGDGHSEFSFIDGDCIPEPDFIEQHLKALRVDEPAAVSGRRLEHKQSHGRDQRELTANLMLHTQFETVRIASHYLLSTSASVWTCNFGINLPAVKIVRDINRKYFCSDGVFTEFFSGRWGGEDGFVGIVLRHAGIPIYSLPAAVGHIEHERKEDTHDPNAFESDIQELIAVLDFLAGNNP